MFPLWPPCSVRERGRTAVPVVSLSVFSSCRASRAFFLGCFSQHGKGHGRRCDWPTTLFLLIFIVITRRSSHDVLLGMSNRLRGQWAGSGCTANTCLVLDTLRGGDTCQAGPAPSPFTPPWLVSVPAVLTEDFLALCPSVLVPHPQTRPETRAEKRRLPAQVLHPGAPSPCCPCVRKRKRNVRESGEPGDGVPCVNHKSPDCETKISPRSQEWEWADLLFGGHHPVQIHWWPAAGDQQRFR